MKVKRNKVIAKYKNILENFYKKQQIYFKKAAKKYIATDPTFIIPWDSNGDGIINDKDETHKIKIPENFKKQLIKNFFFLEEIIYSKIGQINASMYFIENFIFVNSINCF